ncbi:MAG: FecR domain-containing protein [Acidobacteriota bacterium]|nr:FecR domain-containing protein [Acidobacteriota bacterium]
MSDYLWDKSGAPDPEIERLEALLAPLAHKPGNAPELRTRRPVYIALAIAASMVIVAGAVWMIRQQSRPAWTVAGMPWLTRLAKGDTLQTNSTTRASLGMESVGEVDIEPNSRVDVLAVRPDEQRLSLRRGKMEARIWAPPGRFFVNTPSAVTVDLGCAYSLEVQPDGTGLVKVSVGWVAFESDGRESFIPATAACITRPGKGPGTPWYEDSAEAFQRALERFDERGDLGAIDTILGTARARDAITLWHLLRRVPGDRRGVVYDRLAQFIAVPPDVTREGILAGDAKMIDALWDTLDLGNTAWWRLWKSKAPGR